MKIKVLFDKSSVDKNLKDGWGLSFLLDGRILFDTGENGEWLLYNIKYLGIDLNLIEAVVISHDHWDHWGGLWRMLEERHGLRVYICPRFSKEFKEKAVRAGADLVELSGSTEIAKGIFVTGEIPGAYHGRYMAEQAAVLKTDRGLTIVTGCAHPGILKILEKVKEKNPRELLYFVLGGFHLKESDRRSSEIAAESFMKLGVIKVGPTHCSGELAEEEFSRLYGKDFVRINTGEEMEV